MTVRSVRTPPRAPNSVRAPGDRRPLFSIGGCREGKDRVPDLEHRRDEPQRRSRLNKYMLQWDLRNSSQAIQAASEERSESDSRISQILGFSRPLLLMPADGPLAPWPSSIRVEIWKKGAKQ